MLLMPDTPLEGAMSILSRVLVGVSSLRLESAQGPFQINVSAGVSQFRQGDTMESLLQRADEALYKAKVDGRNRICVVE